MVGTVYCSAKLLSALALASLLYVVASVVTNFKTNALSVQCCRLKSLKLMVIKCQNSQYWTFFFNTFCRSNLQFCNMWVSICYLGLRNNPCAKITQNTQIIQFWLLWLDTCVSPSSYLISTQGPHGPLHPKWNMLETSNNGFALEGENLLSSSGCFNLLYKPRDNSMFVWLCPVRTQVG